MCDTAVILGMKSIPRQRVEKGGREQEIETHLKDVVVLKPLSSGDLLCDGHRVREVFIWEFVEFCCMVYSLRVSAYYNSYSGMICTFRDNQSVAL